MDGFFVFTVISVLPFPVHPPKPLSGLAEGSILPCCAAYSDWPMSRRTSRGKARRSRRLEPIQIMGRSRIIIHEYVYEYIVSRETRRTASLIPQLAISASLRGSESFLERKIGCRANKGLRSFAPPGRA